MHKESHPPTQTEVGIFSSEKSNKGAEKPPFSYDDLPKIHTMGTFICRHTGEEMPIEITPRSWAFFDRNFDEPRVIYQGSGLITSMLMGEKEISTAIDRKTGPLAFFDTDGNFHDTRYLLDIEEYTKTNGRTSLRHRAIFEYGDGSKNQEAIEIDNIYCLAAVSETN